MRARRLALAAAALALLAPAGCSKDGPGRGEARLTVDGEAVVERAGGGRDVVHDDADVGSGDRVEVVDGTATLALAGGVRLELRDGLPGDAESSAPSRVAMGSVPVLEAGDLLVTSPGRTVLEAAGTTVEVAGGAAKLSRDLGAAVAVYDADVSLDSAGQEVGVRPLREVQVPSLGRAQPERPLRYDPADPWDRRFLGDAIELGDRITELANAYTSTLQPGEGRTPGFFRLVLPGLEDEPSLDTLMQADPGRSPGDRLIGAAITDLGERGSFDDRWAAVFAFRDEGAHWGLVALDQAVDRTPLVGAITEAVNATSFAFAAPTTSSPTSGTTSPTAPGTTSTTTSQPTTTAPPQTTSPPPPTTGSPLPTTPLDPAIDPVVEPVTTLVDDLVDGLLGLLGPPPPP